MTNQDPCRRLAPRHKGFSLAEVLIAIGVLGIGIAMIGVLFPTALAESKSSVNSVMGTMICQNGFAVCKALISCNLSDINDSTTFHTIPSSALGDRARTYPFARDSDPASARGFVALAKRAAVNGNDFYLVTVSYTKSVAGHGVKAHTLSGSSVAANSNSY